MPLAAPLCYPSAPMHCRRTWSQVGSIALLLAMIFAAADAAAQPTDAFTEALARGPLYAAGAALIGGFLVSLTPCVYPMIAITVSIFGAREAKSRVQGMLLSTAFVAGIVAMFVPLGLVAGLTGDLFGSLLSNRWVNVGIAVVFLALAVSMFGAFEMVLPDRLMQRLSGVGGIGYGGAFLLGLVSGIVAAPCTGPVLTGILLWIGKTQSPWLGAGAMTAFSVGLGVPFWLVGTFAVNLPKSGKWMLWVKSFFGAVLVVASLYFLQIAFPILAGLGSSSATFLGMAIAITVAGAAVGAIHLDWGDDARLAKARKAVGIGMMAVGGFAIVAHLQAVPESVAGTSTEADGAPLLTFGHSEAEARAQAKAEKRPLLVDFTADWCIACGKLDRTTFADPRVKRKAGHFVAVKVDVSVDEDLPDEEQERQEEEFDAIKDRYGVVGLPTVILFDSSGTERARVTDYVGPDEFLELLDGIE